MFERFTDKLTKWVGTPYAVVAYFVLVFVWLSSGPIFQFGDTWQLFINTITTISTGGLVFIIQAAQNKGDRATHAKLDAILKYIEDERADEMIGVDEKTKDEIEELRTHVR